MKIGDKVAITWEAEEPETTYTNAWTEKYTGEKILKKGTKLWHSSQYKIKKFYPDLTCFSYDYSSKTGYIYCLVIKEDIEGSQFDYDEIRLNLENYVDNNKIEIYYAGTGKLEKIRDQYGRVETCKTHQRIMKEFLEM